MKVASKRVDEDTGFVKGYLKDFKVNHNVFLKLDRESKFTI